MTKLYALLILDEGLELKPYRCTSGKLTLGVGRNIEDVGITRDEALYLLDNDLAERKRDLAEILGPDVLAQMNDARQAALVSMLFMGRARFEGFRRMLDAVRGGFWAIAADEMRKSKWYRQVGERGPRLAGMMRTGKWPQSLQGSTP